MKRELKIILAVCVNLAALAHSTAGYSVPEHPRARLSFNQGWLFNWGDPSQAVNVGFDDSDWYGVNLPHTVRIEPVMASGGLNYQGQSVYRKHFTLPREFKGKRVTLEFEAAMHEAEVWLNGKKVTTHYGGYLPFFVDLTDCKMDGRTENVMVVRLDNSDNPDIPPGKPQSGLDFCYFGGIYRDAWIHVTEPVYITNPNEEDLVAGGGVFVRYENVSEQSADVLVKTHFRNTGSGTARCTLKTELLDRDGNVVAVAEAPAKVPSGEAETLNQKLVVENPKLWWDTDPYLHTLRSTLLENGHVVDVVETRVGIRSIEFNLTDGFLLNGKRVVLNGWNRHQEYPYIGNALPNSLHVKDALKTRSLGFNFCRIGHYPHDPAFMDACDELGILTIVPTPGWHFYKNEERFRSRVFSDIRNMIRRDRNRPSVVIWESILNETWTSDEFLQKCYDITHAEYPGDMCFVASDPNHGKMEFDVIYGWQSRSNRPSLSREYNDAIEQRYGPADIYDPNKSHYRCHRGTKRFYCGGEQGMLWSCRDREARGVSSLNGHFGLCNKNEGFAGMALWAGIDHNRGYWSHTAAVGVLDYFRLPKFSAELYRSQRDPNEDLSALGVDSGPTVFIANFWTENSARDVRVFSNGEEVTLSLNGRKIATQKPEHPEWNHPHPSFLFENVPWEAGLLKADAKIGGKTVASHEVRTPGNPANLELVADSMGIDFVADGSDILTVYAYVKDENGTVCSDAYNRLRFSVEGEATIVGDDDPRIGANPVDAEAGIIAVLLQSTATAGKIRLTVESDGLEPASIEIKTVEPKNRGIVGKLPKEVKPMVGTPKLEGDDPSAIYLGDMPWKSQVCGWKRKRTERKRAISGLPIRLNGINYKRGLGLHANGEVVFELTGREEFFYATVGVDDAADAEGSVVFSVWGDDEKLFESGLMRKGEAEEIAIKLDGLNELKLKASDGGDGIKGDHGNFADARFVVKEELVERTDLAENKAVQATSAHAEHPAKLAVDGNLNTYWIAAEKKMPQMLVIDLGGKEKISRANLSWGNDRTHYFYDLEIWTDGRSWKKVCSKTRSGQDLEDDIFDAQTARYLRVKINRVVGPGEFAQLWNVSVY